LKIKPAKLQEAAEAILLGLGASAGEALEVARLLIQAEARGNDTHGLHLLTLIEERTQAGMLFLPTRLTLLADREATAHLDGGNGLGQQAASEAMRLAITKAKTYGLGLCLVKNTNNIGILSAYSLMAAAAGQVGMVMANAAPSLSPWGGAEALLGTNPLSIAIPGGSEGPVVLDMSASVVARGKIRKAARMQEPIPAGWALDAQGNPTTDAALALQGTLLPVGGPKGYGLALAVDLLAGLLAGSQYGRAIKSFHELKGATGVGMLALAIDITRFLPWPVFTAAVEEYLKGIKSCRRAPGVARIYLPGEIELAKEKEAAVAGIEVSPATVQKLEGMLARKGNSLRLVQE
jgi:LDH2 family malate/lactate/ureidoglycolate dehydrogenase